MRCHDRNRDMCIRIDLIDVFRYISKRETRMFARDPTRDFKWNFEEKASRRLFSFAVYSHDHLCLGTGSGTFTSLPSGKFWRSTETAWRRAYFAHKTVDTVLVSKFLSFLYHYCDYFINNVHLGFVHATIQLLTLIFLTFPENNFARSKFVRALSGVQKAFQSFWGHIQSCN